ncbi:MAG: hypothetical protein RIQ93_2056 [Verrucomicrobiota bacterium]|jgi:hypothetical protein
MESSPDRARGQCPGAFDIPIWPTMISRVATGFSLRRKLYLVVSLVAGATAWGEPTFFQARVAPILDRNCTVCHGEEKQKSGLRLDTYEFLQRGGEGGKIVAPGKVGESELYRRITLPGDDEDVMPSDGKPRLTANEVKILELWIASGASPTAPVSAFPNAPAPLTPKPAALPLAPDWRPRAQEIAALEAALNVRLAPRSALPRDGLVLRTVSAPARCDDATLSRLASVAELIVDAELARTKVTDAGLKSVASWPNLRTLDLSRTAVTSDGLSALQSLDKLETLNLTGTLVDDTGVARVRTLPKLRRLWFFGTRAQSPDCDPGK